MNVAPPLLSVIVPTKNRYETLVPVLRALLRHIESDRLEIVVEDNSACPECDELRDLMRNDSRIVYHHDASPLSMVDNTVRAIEHSCGEFLLFIGDDDFVTPYVITLTEQLQRSALACLIFTPARYWWSSVTFARETRFHRPQAFWMPRQVGGRARVLSSAERLRALLRQGGLTYIDMPRFYHGIVRRDALDAIRRKTGTYLPGSSPDMAFSVALSLVIDQYLYVDYPVTVFGASRNSGGGWTAQRRHYGRIEDQQFLPRDIMERWDPMVPRIWSEQTIYPQTIFEVMQSFGRSEHVAYDAFYASLLVNEPHLLSHVWPCVRRRYALNPGRLPSLAAMMIKKAGGRMYRSVQSNSRLMPYELLRFPDVAAAMGYLRDGVAAPEACLEMP